MIDRPILFSAPMVRAILDGKKTQARRIIRKPSKAGEWAFTEGLDWARRTGRTGLQRLGVADGVEWRLPPYCKVGDRLWVKETVGLLTGNGHRIVYRADADTPLTNGEPVRGMKWTPSIFMRREHSRITLLVESVRIERIQDITEDDAECEGVEPLTYRPLRQSIAGDQHGRTHGSHPHTLAFAVLWDTINGDRAPWVSNPWVWVVGFERIEP